MKGEDNWRYLATTTYTYEEYLHRNEQEATAITAVSNVPQLATHLERLEHLVFQARPCRPDLASCRLPAPGEPSPPEAGQEQNEEEGV
jgi:hypothetical protein